MIASTAKEVLIILISGLRRRARVEAAGPDENLRETPNPALKRDAAQRAVSNGSRPQPRLQPRRRQEQECESSRSTTSDTMAAAPGIRVQSGLPEPVALPICARFY